MAPDLRLTQIYIQAVVCFVTLLLWTLSALLLKETKERNYTFSKIITSKDFIMLFEIFLIYLLIINLIAISITIYDKNAAKKGKWRIKESTLLLVSLLGGSTTMLATMFGIRHKTKKPKFMFGIPLIILLQLSVVVFVLVKL